MREFTKYSGDSRHGFDATNDPLARFVTRITLFSPAPVGVHISFSKHASLKSGLRELEVPR
jgi:hypothetical protein